MRFYIEFDEKENFIAIPRIVKQLSILKGLEDPMADLDLNASKINLYGCLGTKLFLDKEGHWKMEFLPEYIN